MSFFVEVLTEIFGSSGFAALATDWRQVVMIFVACVLLYHNHLTFPAYIVIPVAGAGIATVVEMVSKEGYDTVLCPAAAMAVMIPLMWLFGGFS